MESNWAAEHLQTIRTLMERSAVYRRALAPIMIFVGLLGCSSAFVGWITHLKSSEPDKTFIYYWFGVSVIAIVGSFLMTRRQALKAAEPFWTPPARRVADAITPPLFFGAVTTIIVFGLGGGIAQGLLPPIWMSLYGCALHAAGFFMPRGIRLLAWFFVASGSILLIAVFVPDLNFLTKSGHLAMGAVFGGLHLAYGMYLCFTEKRGNET